MKRRGRTKEKERRPDQVGPDQVGTEGDEARKCPTGPAARKPAKKRGWLPELARDRHIEAVGVALVLFGFLITALVWSGIRDTTNVAYQLPIIASGGLVAMGCFTVGGMLLVGGIVMTRFARIENARKAHRLVPPPPAGDDGEVLLPEESIERRSVVRSRRGVSAGTATDN